MESLLGFKGGFSTNPQHSVSPDGKYILGTAGGTGRREIVALPLEEGAKAVTLTALPAGEQSLQAIMPLGWISDGRAVYLLEGVQPYGPHKGSPGIGVYRQEPGGSPEEAGFIPPMVFRGRCWFVPQSSAVFLQVGGALWKVDLRRSTAEELISNLPSYDGLFYPILSPDGAYFVYRLHETDKSGIYVLNTQMKTERPLLPDGETMSFFPQWSPDGRWIAVYTVPRDPAYPGQNIYQEFGDVDGPMPISHSLTVLGPDGSPIRTVTVPGKLLSDFRWSADSRALSFQAGTVQPSGMIVPSVRWVQESLWVAPVNQDVMWTGLDTEKVADLPQESPSWFSHLPVPFGKTVYYSLGGKNVLRGAPSGDPLTVKGSASFRPADQSWWPATSPAVGHLAVAWLWPTGYETLELWVLGANGARRIAEYSLTKEFDARVVACGKDLLVVYHSDQIVDPTGRFDVFRFNPDDFVPRYAEDDPLSKVKAAVDRYMAESNLGNEIVRCVEVDQHYYLVELKARGSEFFYLYVDKQGTAAMPAATHADRPVFRKCENGEAWFECDRLADNFTTFPYYQVTRPQPVQIRRVPLFKAPDDDCYEVSHSGLAYQVRDLAVSDSGIFVQFDITGPGKGGVVAGAPRPPKTFITESGSEVTFRFMDVLMPEPLKKRLSSHKGAGAEVIGVTSQGDCIDVMVRVSGEYSFLVGWAGPTPPAPAPSNTYLGSSAISILFRPDPTDNSFDARKVRIGDSIAGLKISKITDLNERELGGKAIYSVRVSFSGQVTLTGTYFHDPAATGPFPDPLDCQFRFHPDEESAARLPRLEDDNRFAWFVLANHDQAEEQLGPPGSTGKATIVISEYTINRTYSDEYNHARLVKVVEK